MMGGGDRSDFMVGYGSGADNAPRLPTAVVLPVSRRPMFPGLPYTIPVRNPEVVEALKRLRESSQPYVGVFMLKDDMVGDGEEDDEGDEGGGERDGAFGVGSGSGGGAESYFVSGDGDGEGSSSTHSDGGDENPEDVVDPSRLYHTGSFASIQQMVATPGATLVLLRGHRRITLDEILETPKRPPPPLVANITHLSERKKKKKQSAKKDREEGGSKGGKGTGS